ncbi:MAG TPA: hypothetical protein VF691_00620 [Cytophagaceae bacterium]|jgi:hypothetical protein
MTPKALSLTISLLGLSLFNSNDKYLTIRKTISEVRVLEEGLKSELLGFKKMGVSEDFFDGAQKDKDYYPLKFKRNNDTFYPNLNVEYFYTESDSTVNAVVYDWDIMNHVNNLKTDVNKIEEQVSRKKEYEIKYNSVQTELIELLGEPIVNKKEKSQQGYFYHSSWEKGDMLTELRMSFTPKLQQAGPFKFGTFRIRLKTFWKR